MQELTKQLLLITQRFLLRDINDTLSDAKDLIKVKAFLEKM